RNAPALWIDLTGNALSSLAIKCAGAGSLVAQITRGGRSMIDHPLPHRSLENEYENVNRVAEYLGCNIDHSIFDRLDTLSRDGIQQAEGAVVLSLTTACRWKNWPLNNFLMMVKTFPEAVFALT